jgi:Diphthamide biosynthesis methyltransferase
VTLHFVGLGLNSEGISLEGLRRLEEADAAFVEFYTNLEMDLSGVEERTGAEIEELPRAEVEREMLPVEAAESGDAVFLVPGDPFAATTHQELRREAEERDLEVSVSHAGSVLTAVGETGLDLYRFGRTVTLPSHGCPPSVVNMIAENDSVGLHTMVLLDPGLGIGEAAEMLRQEIDNSRCVACSRLGTDQSSTEVADLSEVEGGGSGPHCLVLMGDTTDKEEEYIG